MREKNNDNGVCYTTRAPKIRLKDDWQIKLEVIANTDRGMFDSDKGYRDYIEEHTKLALEEQKIRLKKARADLDKELGII